MAGAVRVLRAGLPPRPCLSGAGGAPFPLAPAPRAVSVGAAYVSRLSGGRHVRSAVAAQPASPGGGGEPFGGRTRGQPTALGCGGRIGVRRFDSPLRRASCAPGLGGGGGTSPLHAGRRRWEEGGAFGARGSGGRPLGPAVRGGRVVNPGKSVGARVPHGAFAVFP